MAVISENISQWPCLSDGLHYNWLVDYAAFSAFGTFELSPEEWEKRELIVNFKGNSELTTEIDHQQALKKAIDMVVSFLKDVLGNESSSITLVCIPASLKKHTERRFHSFSEQVCAQTGLQNAYDAFSYTTEKDEDGDETDTLHIDESFFKGKKVLLFDDMIATGGSISRFAEKLKAMDIYNKMEAVYERRTKVEGDVALTIGWAGEDDG